MRSKHSFNKIWLIESLAVGELKTGKRLYEDYFEVEIELRKKLQVVLVSPNTKEEFLTCLSEIRKDIVENKNYPLIHLECHGGEDGLQLANSEKVPWLELKDALMEINFACELNLMIVVAACKGAYLIKTAIDLDKAPFYAIVGSLEKMTAAQVQADFRAFYTEFFETLDGNRAIDVLNEQAQETNRSYTFQTAELLFLRAYKIYHKENCSGQALKKRKEDLLTKSMSQPEIRKKGLRWARTTVKRWFKEEQERAFYKMKSRYFGLDDYPHNVERFTLTYEAAIK